MPVQVLCSGGLYPLADFLLQPQSPANAGEGVISQPGDGLACQLEGIQPGAESVPGEGSQEAFFRGGIVADYQGALQVQLQFRPEGGKVRGVL